MEMNMKRIGERQIKLHVLLDRCRQLGFSEKDEPFSRTSKGKERVLALLRLRDGISTKQLSEILHIRVTSLNESLARLEREGLVERRPSENDGRVMLVFLTEAGREGADDGAPEVDMLKGFTEEELDTYVNLTDKMIANLEEAMGPEEADKFEQEWEARMRMVDDFMRGRRPNRKDFGWKDRFDKDGFRPRNWR
jgi:DNA-binding MarR family transcriptional regulator